ncbi:MAG: response regulator [Succinivibrionaceae bacterium]|nr:response regulator [Succinivibrionaceae bacterium]
MRVLLVEDDDLVGGAVRRSLEREGYAVDWVRDGAAARSIPFDEQYGVIILDLGLPRVDGEALLAEWRGKGLKAPVIIMTARDALDDRVRGLDLGADDYVVKPFAFEELDARIRAVTRRSQGGELKTLSNGVLTLNPATHEVEVRGADGTSSEVSLTAREFSLLQALLERPGAVLSRAALEQRIYSWHDEVDSNAVEFLIHSLRKKIGSDQVKNVRGAGWKVPRQS